MGGIVSRVAQNRIAISVGAGLCAALLSNYVIGYVDVVKPNMIVAPVILNRGIVDKAQDIFRENPLLSVVSRPLFALNAILTGIF